MLQAAKPGSGGRRKEELGISITFTVDGLDEITSRLSDISDKVREFQASEPRDITDKMAEEMQSIAPVRTGYLRDHIMSQEEGEGQASVVSEADYSIYVEFGTRHMSAQPFFFPVVDKFNLADLATDFEAQVSL